jgi:uncharacterized phiE125 gp8 family phage protein
MSIRLEPKRPDERRRFGHDWTPFLGADTISSQTTTSADVTIVSSSIDTGSRAITFTVDGGTDGTNAIITQAIVTAAGDHETETFILPIAVEELLTLGEVKEYLGLFTSDRDRTLLQMIPRARRWVEDHTGIALVQREFVERLLPSSYGIVRLSYGPLVSVDSVDYLDSSGAAATLTPTVYPPTGELIYAGGWPGLASNERFAITYTAGSAGKDVDDRLRGAMLALIEGEFSEGYAYPPRATEAAERCCAYLRQMVA